ncbi:50S ribosomal protein L11 methyltransferase [Pigmentiphaga sp. NML030171]|uniref:50S ribosomal protein L11 methyltransferase n=1 Tax=Pigmentiphaga sp. NML030171 TaxID=2008676 RepID=UPI001124F751|nr:50S ribosomal protein L11 methyltransferase [Pigmentiphaga sp. NML030171]
MQLQDRIDEAIVSYSTALSYQADDVQAHHNLGMLMEQTGHIEEARLHYQAALTISPTFIPAHRALADIAMRTVPLWHVPMMNDVGRNEAYQAALSRAVTPGSVVFEIGTGSGLLAMMAAKLGAETVVTCEADATIAETAIEVIKRNGYTSKIHVVPVHSSDIHIGDQLPRSPDVFVSEVFSSELLGEHVLGAIEDAKRRILAPTTKIIPQAASIMIALVGGDSLCDNLFVGDVCDFDLRPFNSIIPKRQPLAREDLTPQLLSDPVEAFSFDFRRQTAWAGQTKSIEISATRDGKCVGILQWIRVYLDDKSTFENAPDNRAAAASWTRSVYLFSEPTMLQRGDVATVLGTHNRNCPWFVLEKLKQPSRQIAANAT